MAAKQMPEDIDQTSSLSHDRRESAEPEQIPAQLGRYRVTAELGRGSYGAVYKGFDEELDRQVAIKVPHRNRITCPSDVDSYLSEARAVASLDHSGIVPVHDVGRTEDGRCYVVSKFIEGNNLRTWIKRARPSCLQAAAIVARVAEALHHAHQRGLVHRDIKPANILLDRGTNPFVADFGLALRDEDVGKGPAFAGTLTYMSPEQARGEGHLVDARTDIYSLGVVLYELTTGQRPFRAQDNVELLEQIYTREPRPPRQLDRSIPREVDRICLKALARRSSERYSTALDFAEDLQDWLAQNQEQSAAGGSDGEASWAEGGSDATELLDTVGSKQPTTSAALDSDQRAVQVVPKGLRSFEAEDADFFLRLLPGPHDRHGLPESIRFWKARIEERDADKTFRVGLLYGPSGCGKSSLVKAGLLPRLTDTVHPLYLEAASQATEARLLNRLRKLPAGLPDDRALVESLADLRRGQGLPSGNKVLLVIDQFEQWLHARRGEENSELVQALRQCDGARVQCLVMVRDDFGMAAARFMEELEIPILQGQNFATVDLFDPRHARKVLAGFGQAFEALPDEASEPSRDQEAFLEQAVHGLAQDGKVISVRLALFAEMVKSRPWVPATLKSVGGMEGIGVTFLNETFSSLAANPTYRLHQRAARSVLRALLPEQGTDIRGYMRSRDRLLEASGYAGRPKQFGNLLQILDGELRLVTPTDAEGFLANASADGAPAESAEESDASPGLAPSDQHYQLTHDFLVPALRQWLSAKQRETMRGRAELRLAERTATWAAKRQSRNLPAVWEWANIVLFTRHQNRAALQRQMMRVATRQHLLKLGVLSVLLVLLSLFAREWRMSVHAESKVSELKAADIADVPKLIPELSPFRRWADPHLQRMSTGSPAGSNIRLKQRLALLPVDRDQVKYLYDMIFEAPPDELHAIVDVIDRHLDEQETAKLSEQLWHELDTDLLEPSRRFRAACALAQWDGGNARWAEQYDEVAETLAVQEPASLEQWWRLLSFVRQGLQYSAMRVCRDPSKSEAERSRAMRVLAGGAYAAKRLFARHLDLFLEVDYGQFDLLLPYLLNEGGLDDLLMAVLDKESLDGGNLDKLARQQASAAALLLQLHQRRNANVLPRETQLADRFWPLFRGGANPRLRTYLLHRLGRVGADPTTLIRQLEVEDDNTARQGLLLSLGEFTNATLPALTRTELKAELIPIYRNDPDPGIHSAVEWLLRKWGFDKDLRSLTEQLVEQVPSNRGWYVNRHGHTFAVISRGPVEFQMGSTVGDIELPADQALHTERIPHAFAVATHETTVEQFSEFLPNIRSEASSSRSDARRDSPAVDVTWFEAAQYCRWLSEQEGIPEEQMCYPPLPDIKPGMELPIDYLNRTGYRLPTEAEWEFSCRAGTSTSRHFAAADDMLGHYAWYVANSRDRPQLVGQRMPNGYGLFDTYGNAWEWCQDGQRATTGPARATDVAPSRGVRGGSFRSPASNLRSAARILLQLDRASDLAAVGFRVARTLP